MIVPLFQPGETGLPQVSEHWCETNTSDCHGLALFARHYSRRKFRKVEAKKGNYRWLGPGEIMVLISPSGDAVFAWRITRYRLDAQTGVECSIFRNEGPALSSEMIKEADSLADERWGNCRHFTFVDSRKIQSANPGYCFVKAGWRHCGRSKCNGLHILERVVNAD